MCFEKTRTVTEDIYFDAHELSFVSTIVNGKFSSVKFFGQSISADDKQSIDRANEESLREFHRRLGEVLAYVDEQRAVGREDNNV